MNLFFQVQKFPTKTSTPSRGKNVQKSSAFYRLSIENYFLHKVVEVLAVILPVIQAMAPQVTLEIFLQAKDLQWDLVVRVDPEVQVVQWDRVVQWDPVVRVVLQVQATCRQAVE